MIGNFTYADVAADEAVNVSMEWRDSRRAGRLVLAPALHDALAAADYPALESEELGLESAISYALFIAMRAQIPLLLTGDSSVWNPEWGELVLAGAANDQPVVHRGASRH